MSFQEAMAKMFPVNPEHIKTCIDKLMAIRDSRQAVITSRDAATILNALVRYEATVHTVQGTTSVVVPGVTEEA